MSFCQKVSPGRCPIGVPCRSVALDARERGEGKGLGNRKGETLLPDDGDDLREAKRDRCGRQDARDRKPGAEGRFDPRPHGGSGRFLGLWQFAFSATDDKRAGPLLACRRALRPTASCGEPCEPLPEAYVAAQVQRGKRDRINRIRFGKNRRGRIAAIFSLKSSSPGAAGVYDRRFFKPSGSGFPPVLIRAGALLCKWQFDAEVV